MFNILPLSAQTVSADSRQLQDLRAHYANLLKAQSDFDQSRQGGQLSDAEQADYTAWIRQLAAGVQKECSALMRAGTSLPEDLPCDQFISSGTSAAVIDLASENTEAEITERMIDQLNGSLGAFDERLLQEQDRIKAQKPRTDSGADASAGGTPGAGGSDSELDGAEGKDEQNGETSTNTETGDQGDNKGSQPSGGKRQGTAGAPGTTANVPDDIPDGSDDDVVARQLREAAEKEQDPVLREKLWEEYRRYKAGIN